MIRCLLNIDPLMKKLLAVVLLPFASAAFATPCETIEVAELNLMSKEERTMSLKKVILCFRERSVNRLEIL